MIVENFKKNVDVNTSNLILFVISYFTIIKMNDDLNK